MFDVWNPHPFRIRALGSFKMLGNTSPVTQHHWGPQDIHCLWAGGLRFLAETGIHLIVTMRRQAVALSDCCDMETGCGIV